MSKCIVYVKPQCNIENEVWAIDQAHGRDLHHNCLYLHKGEE